MFIVGILLLLLAAIFVYATQLIYRIVKPTTVNAVLYIKLAGLVMAIIGGVLIFFSETPQSLQLF